MIDNIPQPKSSKVNYNNKEIFLSMMGEISSTNNKFDDDEYITNDKRSMNEHNECYTRILETYSYTLEANILEKNKLKKNFFMYVQVF